MKHYNPSISQDMDRLFNLKGESTDSVYDEIIPVIPITRDINIAVVGTGAGSGATTIYTTPSDKDFYLTAFFLHYQADAANDCTELNITTNLRGLSTKIFKITKITLTATTEYMMITLPNPIKVDRNSAITLNATFTVGNCPRTAGVYGYTVETTKGV